MKMNRLTTALVAATVLLSAPHVLLADQRPRNPGSDSGGGGGGGSSSPRSGGSDSGGTGRVASPRDGGGSPWGGGSVSSRPSEPRPSSGGGSRRPARVSGGSGGSVRSGDSTIPPYSRARGSAPVTGYGVARGSIATLPPIISGPIYWGPDNWYFYPWGFGGLGLGYFWDPWMWNGYYGGYYGGMGSYGYGGYPWVDPYYGGGVGGGGGGGVSDRDDDEDEDVAAAPATGARNPLDPNAPTGGLRLKVEPRTAEVLVDGFLAGRVDDFDGAMQRLKITEGPHRVELRAPGYESATFSVTIVVGQTTTYKTDLKPR
jgi:hypothetical protein